MLVALKNEWDEVMLETFALKQALDTTRKELSQTLYQHDAACRVIARLMAENAELNALVGNGNGAGNAAGAGAGAMDVDASTAASASVVATTPSVLPPAVHTAVTAKQEALHAARKGNKHPNLTPKDRIINGGTIEASASADVDIGKSKAAKTTGLHHCTANLGGDLLGAVDTALIVTCVVDGDIVSSKFKAGAKVLFFSHDRPLQTYFSSDSIF
jgi:hypothetical protein